MNALVADRKLLIDLTEECDAVGSNDTRPKLSDCVINDEGLSLLENSVARAATQIELLANYFAALDALAKSKGPSDIENAAGAAISSIGGFAAAVPGGGLGEFATSLQDRRTGIIKASSFFADQYRHRKLRSVVSMADPAIERIVLALVDTAEMNGIPPTSEAYLRLTDAQDLMDTAKNAPSDVEYASAIRNFFAAYDEFVLYREKGLIPRLELIRETHAALLARLNGPATPQEIIALIDKLKVIETGFE